MLPTLGQGGCTIPSTPNPAVLSSHVNELPPPPCLAAIFLLGFGLVAVPKQLWFSADLHGEQRRVCHQAGLQVRLTRLADLPADWGLSLLASPLPSSVPAMARLLHFQPTLLRMLPHLYTSAPFPRRSERWLRTAACQPRCSPPAARRCCLLHTTRCARSWMQCWTWRTARVSAALLLLCASSVEALRWAGEHL